MEVPRILETAVYVDDLVAAEQFYREVLGLEAFSRMDGRHAFFRCGPQVLLLFDAAATAHPTEGAPIQVPLHGSRGPGHVAFAVPEGEYDRWRTRLRSKKIEIEQEIDWPGGGRSLYFRDPTGNSLELATPALWGIAENDLFD